MLHVSQDLGFVNPFQGFHALDLDDDLPIDEYIDSIGTFQHTALVVNGDWSLDFEGYSPQPKLMGEGAPVRRFEETWTEVAMRLDRAPDYLV